MFHLLNLPRDLLIQLLLHHFTLQEVIRLRCLCHELYNLVHYCLGRRRSLKLFFNFLDVQDYTQLLYEHNLETNPALRLHRPGPSCDVLILDERQFLHPMVDLLVERLFPNVTHLVIFINYVFLEGNRQPEELIYHHTRRNVIYLLERMRTRLTGLSLFGRYRGDNMGTGVSRQLVHSINQMDNLTRLDLCVRSLYLCTNNQHYAYMDGNEIVQQPEQPFLVLEPKLLSKLERISVLFAQERNGPNFCEHSFRHLGPNLT